MDAVTHTPADIEASYLSLLQAFPPHPIRTDAELNATIAVIDELLDRPDTTPAEQEFLELLGDLIENYERARVVVPAVSGVQLLLHLMKENGLKQGDLASLFGGKSVVSEVLGGKRALSKTHIRRLSERFNLPADVFFG